MKELLSFKHTEESGQLLSFKHREDSGHLHIAIMMKGLIQNSRLRIRSGEVFILNYEM